MEEKINEMIQVAGPTGKFLIEGKIKELVDGKERQRLVVCIMGENVASHIDMCLESVKDADAIVFCDGGSTDNTLHLVNKFNYREFAPLTIQNEFNQEDPSMNGKQRNFYLNYLKENYKDWWCLCLDADEVASDGGINQLKKDIQLKDKDGMYSVKMEHLIGDLQHVDATKEIHYVGHRLFKIHPNLFYPEVEHPVLQYINFSDTCGYKNGLYDKVVIWHLAGILDEMLMFKRKYDKNIKHSNIHNKEFLDAWFTSHVFGTYPKRQINIEELPRPLFSKLGMDKDEIYFGNRNLEVKHFIMSKEWIDYFKPKSVIEFGCGKAPFGFAIKSYGVDYDGIELSKYAVNNAFVPIIRGDIQNTTMEKEYDLVLAIDVLEHLDDRELDNAMTNLIAHGSDFLFSVPVVGDPNLLNDKTHKQFKTRDEWIKFWESYGFKIITPPESWMFAPQLFIGKKV